MCLHIHAKFRGDRPFGGGGGQIDPPPSKNLLSKSPVKIGLILIHGLCRGERDKDKTC